MGQIVVNRWYHDIGFLRLQLCYVDASPHFPTSKPSAFYQLTELAVSRRNRTLPHGPNNHANDQWFVPENGQSHQTHYRVSDLGNCPRVHECCCSSFSGYDDERYKNLKSINFQNMENTARTVARKLLNEAEASNSSLTY